MADDFMLDKGKLKSFLESISDVHKPQLDITDLNKTSKEDSNFQIKDIKNEMQDIKRKLNLLLSSKKNEEDLQTENLDKNLRYLKERVDLLVTHGNIKGQITKMEMKKLRVNILRDKIKYLQKKLDSILTEREKRIELDKDFSMIKQEKLTDLTEKISFLEERLNSIVKSSRPNKDLVDKFKSKINHLKRKSEKLLMKRASKGKDLEYGVIKQISAMLEQKRKELHDLETELMLDQGVVEHRKESKLKLEPEQKSEPDHVFKPEPKIVEQVKTIPKPKPRSRPVITKHDFELPTLFSDKHELDLDLPSPVPLEEFSESMPPIMPTPEAFKKKKSFFAKLFGSFKKKKKRK